MLLSLVLVVIWQDGACSLHGLVLLRDRLQVLLDVMRRWTRARRARGRRRRREHGSPSLKDLAWWPQLRPQLDLSLHLRVNERLHERLPIALVRSPLPLLVTRHERRRRSALAAVGVAEAPVDAAARRAHAATRDVSRHVHRALGLGGERETGGRLKRRHDATWRLRGDAVLQDERVNDERDRGAAAWRQSPVRRPNKQVAHTASALLLGRDIARAHVAHALAAHRDRRRVGQQVAHDRQAVRRLSRADSEARCRCRERRHARRPRHVAHVLARWAVLGLDVGNLTRAPVDAQRDEGVVERRPVRAPKRERLELERHSVVVARDILGVLLAEELGAVADEELPKDAVKVVKRLPDLLVDLDAHRQLAPALAHHVSHREAVVWRPHRLARQGRVGCTEEAEGRHGALGTAAEVDGVDPPELVVVARLLEGDRDTPLLWHRLHVLTNPGHLVSDTCIWSWKRLLEADATKRDGPLKKCKTRGFEKMRRRCRRSRRPGSEKRGHKTILGSDT